MCIDLYSPGRRIDVPFLCEHIYLELEEPARPAKEQLHITEVYDVLVRNPRGSEPLAGLFALFPHDCTRRDDGCPAIEAPEVKKKLATDAPQYEWPFLGPPEELRDGRVKRTYAADPKLGTEALVEEKEGTALHIKVEFPAKELANCKGGSEALRNRNKTLVYLKFLGNVKLEAGQEGWLRLIVKPQVLDRPEARSRKVSASSEECSRWFTIYCPIIIRDNLKYLLNSKLSADSETAGSLETRIEVGEIVLDRGSYSPGTATRIEDHRIAIVAPPEIDIDNPVCTPGAHFHGVYQLEGRTDIALLWATGASKNRESDLVHNARRVLDKLAFLTFQRENELIRDLAPSGKHEAFALLVDKMKQAQLIRAEGPEDKRGLTLNGGDDNTQKERILALRRLYASRDPETSDRVELMQDFSDLHPFSIHYRAGWRALPPPPAAKPQHAE